MNLIQGYAAIKVRGVTKWSNPDALLPLTPFPLSFPLFLFFSL